MEETEGTDGTDRTTKDGGENPRTPPTVVRKKTLAHEHGWWLDEIQNILSCDAGRTQGLSGRGCSRGGKKMEADFLHISQNVEETEGTDGTKRTKGTDRIKTKTTKNNAV